MSEANVSVVMGLLDAWTAGDCDAALVSFDPGVEADLGQLPGGRQTQGRDELREVVAQWRSADQAGAVSVDKVFDAGDEVVVCLREAVTGECGATTERSYAQVFGLRDGSVVFTRTFYELALALEAVSA